MLKISSLPYFRVFIRNSCLFYSSVLYVVIVYLYYYFCAASYGLIKNDDHCCCMDTLSSLRHLTREVDTNDALPVEAAHGDGVWPNEVCKDLESLSFEIFLGPCIAYKW